MVTQGHTQCQGSGAWTPTPDRLPTLCQSCLFPLEPLHRFLDITGDLGPPTRTGKGVGLGQVTVVTRANGDRLRAKNSRRAAKG